MAVDQEIAHQKDEEITVGDNSTSGASTNNIFQDPEIKEKQSAVIHFGEKDTEAFPEGGFGWFVVLGGFLILNATYGMINAFGEFQVVYMKKYPDTKPAVLSLIGSLQPFIIYISCIPVIFFHNTIGPNATVAVGGLIMVFALMMTSLCTAVWQIFLAQGVLYSFGAGISFLTAMSVPPEWFKKRRALAIGIIASGSSLGGVIWPIALHRLIQEIGFPWAVRTVAFIYIPIMSIASLTMKRRLPAVKETLPKWSVAKDWKLLVLSFGGMLGFFGLFPPLQYMPTFADRLAGVSPNVSAYILAILNAASLVGRIGPAHLADKLGRLNMLTIFTLLTGILQLALWLPTRGEPPLVTFAVLWGICSGSYIALLPSSIGQLFGVKDLSSRLAISFLFCGPGSLAGAAIAGTFIPSQADSIVGFNKLIIFSGVLMLAAGVVFTILRLSYSRKIFVFL